MKKAAKFLMPLILGLLIIASILWYLFIYDRAFTRDTLLNQARYQDINGNSRLSSWFYDAAYNFSGHDENVAIELANQYKHDGNYTKAELTLTEAIRNGPTVELYTALSRAYVEQDKLLDAVYLLENVSQPQIKAELDVLRPVTPVPDYAAGYYSEYIHVTLDSRAKYIFYSLDGTYPSIDGLVHQDGIVLPSGQTTITAIAVSEDGLVSPVAVLDYTITGVIEEVRFTDPAVEAAIRQQIGVSSDRLILTNQLWDITEFTVPKDAKALNDLTYLPNLAQLEISGLAIESFDFLSSLLKLNALNLSGSTFPVESISMIAALPSLNSLTLADCNLSTIDYLENAGSLTELDLSHNTIRNLDVLKTMPNLKKLQLQHNAVNSLEALAALDNLEILNVSFNAVTSLKPLSGCTRLTELVADNNSLTNLDGLQTLSLLQLLSVDYNSISDISALTANAALKNVSIASNSVTDISAMKKLGNLEILDFSGNHVESLPEWPDDCPLQTIDGSYNALTSLDTLGRLQSLTHVYMDYNLITNIDALEDCFCLVQVNVFGNAIADVSKLRERDIIVNYDPTAAASAESE